MAHFLATHCFEIVSSNRRNASIRISRPSSDSISIIPCELALFTPTSAATVSDTGSPLTISIRRLNAVISIRRYFFIAPPEICGRRVLSASSVERHLWFIFKESEPGQLLRCRSASRIYRLTTDRGSCWLQNCLNQLHLPVPLRDYRNEAVG